jgi:[protein-PII] uridylyltransferase
MSLDTFYVLDSGGQPIAEDGARLAHIKQYLGEHLGNNNTKPAITARRTPRKMKSFAIPTETRIYFDEIKNVSVLEVSTPDRPGLLARLGRIFVSYNIELQAAKIQTLGERVEDVFFITDDRQQAITDPQLCNALQRTICDELDEQAAA